MKTTNIILHFKDDRGIQFFQDCTKTHLSGLQKYIAFLDAEVVFHRYKLEDLKDFSIKTYR